MKTVICYFSGTGNTKKVVDKFADEFKANGWDVSLFRVEDKCEIDFSEFDSVGIAYPVHAFNAPRSEERRVGKECLSSWRCGGGAAA